jgi:hypothetical protein
MRTKAYHAIITLGLFLVLAASAHAQSGLRMEVAVPFDFHAGATQLAAGTYTVTPLSQVAMLLRSADARTSVLILAPLTAHAQQAAGPARLVFRRYGEQYFLAQIWPRGDYGSALYTSDRERRLARELELGKRGAAQPRKVEVAALVKR